MARRRYRKNPIDGGVNDFFGQIEREADMCNVPLKTITVGVNRMDYTIGQVNDKAIVIQPEICQAVLNNLAVIASAINYVLTNQPENSKHRNIEVLNITFEKRRQGQREAYFTMNSEGIPSGSLKIRSLPYLRNTSQLKKLVINALKVQRVGLQSVANRVNKAFDKAPLKLKSRVIPIDAEEITEYITWATEPDGPSEDDVLNEAIDSVEEAEAQASEALESGTLEDLAEAETSLEAAIDDLNMVGELSEDPALDAEVEATKEELNDKLEEVREVERDLFGDEVRPSAPTRPPQPPRPERTTPIDDPSQMELDFSAPPPPPPPPPAKAWSFSQTDAGVTAVSGPRGAVKNVLSTLQAKLDQYAADEQLYGIDVSFKVEEKSRGSVSASRRGKTITIKVNGAPSISDLINAVSVPLAAIYDEQDIDFDEDGFGLAQELEWS